MRFKKIVIVGVGLIGGTLARAIKKRFPRARVVGVSRRRATAAALVRSRVVDRAFVRFDRAALHDADLVIFAGPAHSVAPALKKAVRFLKKNAIVIDVSSARRRITGSLEKICVRHGVRFVGTHPMFGSEKQGFRGADPAMLKGSLCIITPTRHSDTAALKDVRALFVKLGCVVRHLDPARHDRIVSQISHLPHVLIQALVCFVDESNFAFAGPSFKELSRIASSPCDMWTEIYALNAANISRDLRRYIALLTTIARDLTRARRGRIASICAKAKSKRDRYFSHTQ
jgi:prephenate dehydrogenase